MDQVDVKVEPKARREPGTRSKAGAGKVLKPHQCSGHMRKRLAEEFPGIVNGFVKQAKSGSCTHVKLASELLQHKIAGHGKPKKSSAEKLLEELTGKKKAQGGQPRTVSGRFVK